MAGETGHKASREARGTAAETLISPRCPTIQDYILAVEKAEVIYSSRPQPQSPALMVTALRKVWNDGAYSDVYHHFWQRVVKDKNLIGFKWDRLLEDADGPELDLKAGNPPLGGFSSRDKWVLTGVDCLRTDLHGCIDFGHVLTGVDGSNFPGTLLPKLHGKDADVIAAVTWSGDVGSAYQAMVAAPAPEIQKELRELRKNNPSTRYDEAAWQCLASRDDLLADVDGVVLGHRFKLAVKFSKQLRDYYLGLNNQKKVFADFVKTHPYFGLNNTPWESYIKSFVAAQSVKDPTWDEKAIKHVGNRWRAFLNYGLQGRIFNWCNRKTARHNLEQRKKF